MHRKENCSIPRIDLLDQSRFYIQHTKKLKKMKPAVDTSPIEPVNHFSIAHKEKEKEWEYADSISKMCYKQIQSSKNQCRNKPSTSTLSTSRRGTSFSSSSFHPKINNKNISSKPQFNLRTNIFPSSPKGGIYNYRASFDSSSLSASGMMSPFFTPPPLIDEDGSITSDSTSIFLTQPKKKNYKKYQYSSLDNPRLRQKIQNEQMEISIKDGMKFVEFSGKLNDNTASSNEDLASRLNSKFRKSFFIGPADSSSNSDIKKLNLKNKTGEFTEPYSPVWDLQFDFHSNSSPNQNKKRAKDKINNNKKGKKTKKSQLINNFENVYKVENDQSRIHKRSVKLKILQSFIYEFSSPQYPLSIIWADQKDLLNHDEIAKNPNNDNNTSEEFIGCYANPIDNSELSGSNTNRTAVNFTFDSDEEEYQIILEQSPLQFFESFELEISSQQHVLDILLNDDNKLEKTTEEKENALKETIETNENTKSTPIENNENKLEMLPNQLLNLIDDPVKKDTKNGTNSDYDYSYYSSGNEK